jgi:hypothetical protein
VSCDAAARGAFCEGDRAEPVQIPLKIAKELR